MWRHRAKVYRRNPSISDTRQRAKTEVGIELVDYGTFTEYYLYDTRCVGGREEYADMGSRMRDLHPCFRIVGYQTMSYGGRKVRGKMRR